MSHRRIPFPPRLPGLAPRAAARARAGEAGRGGAASLRRAGLLVAALCLALTSGCAGPGGRPPADGIPPDLELEVLLMEGRGRRLARTREDAPPPAVEAGRWVVLGDGSLHHLAPSARDVRETGVHPSRRTAPRVRTLTAAELGDLWTLVVATGLADSGVAGPPIAPVTVRPDFDETVFLLAARAGGRRWSVVRRGRMTVEELDPAALALLERLRDLAWLGGGPEGRLVPRRYELGDDPWAPYRDPASERPGGPPPGESGVPGGAP